MSTKTCKQCGKRYEYNREVGYAEDLCGPYCDGAWWTTKKFTERLAVAEAANERLRPLVQCCERDHDLDGNCHVHPQGLRGEIERVQSEARILRESLSAVESERDALRTTLQGAYELLSIVVDELAEASKGGRDE